MLHMTWHMQRHMRDESRDELANFCAVAEWERHAAVRVGDDEQH